MKSSLISFFFWYRYLLIAVYKRIQEVGMTGVIFSDAKYERLEVSAKYDDENFIIICDIAYY